MNPPAAPYGLTTTYAYDDNLTDTTGLDATFSAHLAGLSLGADSDGAAVLTTNPAGERTLAIRDGLGRGVRSVVLDLSNTALVSHTSTFDTVVNVSGYGDVLETASANTLGHTNKSRTDGAGRTMQSLDATGAITAFVYNANGQRLSVRDPNNVGQDCTYGKTKDGKTKLNGKTKVSGTVSGQITNKTKGQNKGVNKTKVSETKVSGTVSGQITTKMTLKGSSPPLISSRRSPPPLQCAATAATRSVPLGPPPHCIGSAEQYWT